MAKLLNCTAALLLTVAGAGQAAAAQGGSSYVPAPFTPPPARSFNAPTAPLPNTVIPQNYFLPPSAPAMKPFDAPRSQVHPPVCQAPGMANNPVCN